LVDRRGGAEGPLPRADRAPEHGTRRGLEERVRPDQPPDGLESEPWWANVPDFDQLTVGGIEVGTEAAVRKRLDGMTRQTNAAAAKARKEQDQLAYARQQALKAQEESARRMTERFRTLA
jgi:hypothetical protein